MNKLGIAIKSTLMGSGEAFKYNDGPWSSKVVDVRDALRHVPSLASDPKRTAIFFSFGETGCYITVARCISNREGDNIAGWIYVPVDIRISGDELVDALLKVRDMIFRPELPSKAELDHYFSRSFPSKAASVNYLASPKNGRFAKRDVTPTSSVSMILNSLYQPYYEGFQAIFIEERPGEVNDATDLSNQPLTPQVAVFPPDAATLQAYGISLKFAKTGDPFTQPTMAPVGATIQVMALRRGFEPSKFTVKAEADGVHVELPRINWFKKITDADFNVKDGSGRQIHSGYTIFINNQPLKKELFLTEQELASARIRIQYQNQTMAVEGNLMQLPLTIYTNGGTSPAPKGVEWKVRLADGSRGVVSVEGKSVRSYESPIKGYEVDGDYLVYESNPWIERLIGFGAAIVLGGIVVGILALCGVFGSDDKGNEGVPNGAETQVAVTNMNDEQSKRSEEDQLHNDEKEKEAIAYLNGNVNWKRSEMEEIERLKDLYDDLNTFNFEKVNNFWAKRFKSSVRFNDILEAIKTCEEINGNPSSKTPTKTYNPEGDDRINVDNYINWLSKGCVVAVPDENGGIAMIDTQNKTEQRNEKRENIKNSTNTDTKTGPGTDVGINIP